MKILRSSLLTAATLTAIAGAASATQCSIYDNLSATGTYSSTQGYSIHTGVFTPGQQVGAPFVLTSDWRFDSVDLALVASVSGVVT